MQIADHIAHPYPVIKNLPSVTTTQMIEVDRRMMEDIGICLFQMMENAGLQLANLARTYFLAGDVRGKRVAVLAGSGGNGGGALVAARRLLNWGAVCDVILSKPEEALRDVPRAQLDIYKRIDRAFRGDVHLKDGDYDLIIDGLIGYSLSGDPHGTTAKLIAAVNAASSPILSLDVPSGFDGETGNVKNPSIQSNSTLTLALPKQGMCDPKVAPYVGRLFCADISCPPSVFDNLGLATAYHPPFAQSAIVEVV